MKFFIVSIFLAALALLTLAPGSAVAQPQMPSGQDAPLIRAEPRPGNGIPWDEVSGDRARGVCDNTRSVDGGERYLPVYRWTDSSSLHSRLGTKAWNDITEKLQRNAVMSISMALGNMTWSAAAGLTETAMAACFIDDVGGTIDSAVARIARAVFNSGIVALFVVVAIVIYAFQIQRRGGAHFFSAISKKALIVAIIGIMTYGATQTTGGGASGSPNEPLVPGAGSPAWIATTIDSAVSTAAVAVIRQTPNSVIGGADGRIDPLHCDDYVQAMKRIYKREYGNRVTSSAATVPMLISALWENTGLQAWKNAQFGRVNADGTGYGNRMYCRILEYNNDITPAEVQEVMAEVDRNIGNDLEDALDDMQDGGGESLAFWQASDHKQRDQAYVAWAACTIEGFAPPPVGSQQRANYGPDVNSGINLYDGGQGAAEDILTVTDKREGLHKSGDEGSEAGDCADVFFGDDYKAPDGFNWDDSDGTINENRDSLTPDQSRFLLNLHGNSNAAGIMSSFVYALGGVLILLVFGVFALAVLYAKIAALVMIFMVIFTLIAALMPSSDMSKVTDYLKRYVGLSAFAFGAQLILAILAMFTKILVDIGSVSLPGGPGGTMNLLWAGFAPLLALAALHAMFKKMRVPSPMSVQGGMGWAKMAGTGLLASGMNQGFDRMRSAADRSGRNAAGAGAAGSVGTSVLPAQDRANAMTPTAAREKELVGAGAGGPGAGVGAGAGFGGPGLGGSDGPGAGGEGLNGPGGPGGSGPDGPGAPGAPGGMSPRESKGFKVPDTPADLIDNDPRNDKELAAVAAGGGAFSNMMKPGEDRAERARQAREDKEWSKTAEGKAALKATKGPSAIDRAMGRIDGANAEYESKGRLGRAAMSAKGAANLAKTGAKYSAIGLAGVSALAFGPAGMAIVGAYGAKKALTHHQRKVADRPAHLARAKANFADAQQAQQVLAQRAAAREQASLGASYEHNKAEEAAKRTKSPEYIKETIEHAAGTRRSMPSVQAQLAKANPKAPTSRDEVHKMVAAAGVKMNGRTVKVTKSGSTFVPKAAGAQPVETAASTPVAPPVAKPAAAVAGSAAPKPPRSSGPSMGV